MVIRLSKKEILFILRWGINTGILSLMLYIFIFIFIYGSLRLIEPNKVILLIEIILMIIGLILNLNELKRGRGDYA